MKRTITMAMLALTAGTIAARGQLPGTGNSDFLSVTPMGSVGTDLAMGHGQAMGGVDAQVVSGSASRIIHEDRYSARDGCINYPGQAHNSADCSRIISWDPSWVLPNKPLSEMTGAEENMIRSYNILTHKNAQTR